MMELSLEYITGKECMELNMSMSMPEQFFPQILTDLYYRNAFQYRQHTAKEYKHARLTIDFIRRDAFYRKDHQLPVYTNTA